MEVISGQALNVGAGGANLPAVAGSTLTVRNARLDSVVLLLQAWGKLAVTGFAQIRSPKLHDNVRGIRFGITAAQSEPKLPSRFMQRLVPQDVLIFEAFSADAAANLETLSALLWYEDLAGAQANLISVDELMTRSVSLVTVHQTLALTGAGGYTGAEAINAESDLLKANTDYALVGYVTDVEAAGIFWRGVDSANLRVGGPSLTPIAGELVLRDWFLALAREYNRPMIPVFNSANKGGILLDGIQDEGGADVAVASILAELTPKR
jgi:hypothetical protein